MKTDITLEIEEKLKIKAKRESNRYGFEIRVPGGICDFVTSKLSPNNYNIPHIICYEIKVSFNDYFYSENGSNFVGDENYYVMPDELIEEIIKKKGQSKFIGVGLISYKNGKFYCKTDGRSFRPKLKLEDKFAIMDQLLMKALYDKE